MSDSSKAAGAPPLVERVARAICASLHPTHPWQSMAGIDRDDFRDCARAAIAAMREPTEAMLAAIHDHYDDGPFDDFALKTWQDGIDAALKEDGK